MHISLFFRETERETTFLLDSISEKAEMNYVSFYELLLKTKN